MIIEIESVYGDTLLHGKHIEKAKLLKAVKELLPLTPEKEFASVFCARYAYEAIPYEANVKIDYTIDLDTHSVIVPKY